MVNQTSFVDCWHLWRVGRAPVVYLYEYATRSVRLPTRAEVPWPVEFLLSFHRKHILPSARVDHNPMTRGLTSWLNRQNWKHVSGSNDDPHKFWLLRNKKKTCRTGPGDENTGEVGMLHSEIFTSAWDCCNKAFHERPKFNSLPSNPLAQWGLKILKNMPYVALLSDKDAGFVILHKTDYSKMLTEMMEKPQYKRVYLDRDYLYGHYDMYKDTIGRLANDLFVKDPHLDEEELYKIEQQQRHLRSAMFSEINAQPPTALISVLDCTIKSHKPAGKVVPRAIHACSSHPFAPAQRWLSTELRNTLRTFPHILADSDGLINLIHGMSFEPD